MRKYVHARAESISRILYGFPLTSRAPKSTCFIVVCVCVWALGILFEGNVQSLNRFNNDSSGNWMLTTYRKTREMWSRSKRAGDCIFSSRSSNSTREEKKLWEASVGICFFVTLCRQCSPMDFQCLIMFRSQIEGSSYSNNDRKKRIENRQRFIIETHTLVQSAILYDSLYEC